MQNLRLLGESAWVTGKKDSTSIDFAALDPEVGGKVGGSKGLVVDVTVTVNCAAGGAGITGRRMLDILKFTLEAGKRKICDGISGSQLALIEMAFLGSEPVLPADVAIAAGVVTRQLRLILPFTRLYGKQAGASFRPKDRAILNAVLQESGTLTLTWAANGVDLSTNANDNITAATAKISAMQCPMGDDDAAEAPGAFSIDVFDQNGKRDFPTRIMRPLLCLVVPDNGGTEFAAGEITELDVELGGEKVLKAVPARTQMDMFNKDMGIEATSRRFAPDDTALGVSDFFPIFWLAPGDSTNAIPVGPARMRFTGTKTNFKLLVVETDEKDDDEKIEELAAAGYDKTELKAVPANRRVPKTTRPPAGDLSPRKQRLLPTLFLGVKRTKKSRGKKG